MQVVNNDLCIVNNKFGSQINVIASVSVVPTSDLEIVQSNPKPSPSAHIPATTFQSSPASRRPLRPPPPKFQTFSPGTVISGTHSPSPVCCRNGFAALTEEVVSVSFSDGTLFHVRDDERRVDMHERMHVRRHLIQRKQGRRALRQDREEMEEADINVLSLAVPIVVSIASDLSPPMAEGDSSSDEAVQQSLSVSGEDTAPSPVPPVMVVAVSDNKSLSQPKPIISRPSSVLRGSALAFVPQGTMINYVPLSYEGDPFRPQPSPPWWEVAGDQPTPSQAPTPFTSFGAIPVIREWITGLAQRGNLNLAEMRRQQARVGVDGLPAPDPRPKSDNIYAMFDPAHMLSGANPLPPGVSRLKVEGFVKGHREHCRYCQQWSSGIGPGCYFEAMQKQLICGIRWPMSPGDPVPLYTASGRDGNHRSAVIYEEFLAAKCAKMAAEGHLRPYEGNPSDLVVSPLGVTGQRARQIQMEHATGIQIRDGASYAAASAAFAELKPDFDAMKLRAIMDLTASGINEKCELKRFSYAGLSAALELLTPGCFVAVLDLRAYYNQFPVAEECYPLLGCCHGGARWYSSVLPMGLSPAPYYASSWSAEILEEHRARGVKISNLLDDFIVVGDTLMECTRSLVRVENGFESRGLPLAEDKRQPPSQCVNYLGFRINTVTMTVSVIPAKAAGFLLVLEAAMDALRAGGNVSHSDWNHICSKLEDYAQVSQLGKNYVAWAWSYLTHGPTLSVYGRTNLLSDLEWWHTQLSSWATGVLSGFEYAILNGSVLAANPALIDVVVTDMSGPDGTGAYYGPLLDENPQFFSETWPEGGRPKSSFVGELEALKNTLVRRVEALRASGVGRPPPPSLLISVMDSLGAVQSVNSGRCADVVGRAVLREIYVLCAELRTTVIALWHYRENNSLADWLSHLARSLCRGEVSGRLGDIPGCLASDVTEGRASHCRSDGDEYRNQEVEEDSGAAILELSAVLCRERFSPSPPPSIVQGSGLVSGSVHGAELQSHSVVGWGSVEPSHAIQPTGARIPFDRGRVKSQGPAERVEASRRVGGQSKGPSSFRQFGDDPSEMGPVSGGPAYACRDACNSHPVAATYGGDYCTSPGDTFRLASPGATGVYSLGSYQDRTPGARGVGNPVRHDPRHISLQAPSSVVGGARPGQPSKRVRFLPNDVVWHPPPFCPFGGVGIPPPYQAWGGIHWSG